MAKLVTTILLSLLFLSVCKNRGENSAYTLKQKIRGVFAERDIKTEGYLFMEFWPGMNSFEFRVIADSLLNEKLLGKTNNKFTFQAYLNSGDMTDSILFELNPVFIMEKLVQIELASVSHQDLLYNEQVAALKTLYRGKYGVPDVLNPISTKSQLTRIQINTPRPEKSPAASYDAQFDLIGMSGPPSGYPSLEELRIPSIDQTFTKALTKQQPYGQYFDGESQYDIRLKPGDVENIEQIRRERRRGVDRINNIFDGKDDKKPDLKVAEKPDNQNLNNIRLSKSIWKSDNTVIVFTDSYRKHALRFNNSTKEGLIPHSLKITYYDKSYYNNLMDIMRRKEEDTKLEQEKQLEDTKAEQERKINTTRELI